MKCKKKILILHKEDLSFLVIFFPCQCTLFSGQYREIPDQLLDSVSLLNGISTSTKFSLQSY